MDLSVVVQETMKSPLRQDSSKIHPDNEGSLQDLDMKDPSFLDRFILHPDGRIHVTRTILLLFALLYISATVPFYMGFVYSPISSADMVVDIFFIFDFIMNFFTGYHLEGENRIVMDFKSTSLMYVKSPWALLDFITSVPFDWFGASFGGVDIQFIKILKSLRVSKMLRLSHVVKGDAMEEIEDVLMSSSSTRFFLKILNILMVMGFILHWTSCCWHFAAYHSGKANWISTYFETEDLEEVSISARYQASFYWACTTMTTVGFGDITPTASSGGEQVVATCAVIIGAALYGILVGEMVSIVGDVDENNKQYHLKMDSILSYMMQKQFPRDLQKKIKRYYRRYFRAVSALDEKKVFKDLSNQLKREVRNFMVGGIIFQHQLFKNFTPHQFLDLTNMVHTDFFDADDEIVSLGDEIEFVCIVSSGDLQKRSSTGVCLEALTTGGSVGEEALRVSAPKPRVRFKYSVHSMTVCEMLVFPTSELWDVYTAANSESRPATAEKRRKSSAGGNKVTYFSSPQGVELQDGQQDGQQDAQSALQRKASERKLEKSSPGRNKLKGSGFFSSPSSRSIEQNGQQDGQSTLQRKASGPNGGQNGGEKIDVRRISAADKLRKAVSAKKVIDLRELKKALDGGTEKRISGSRSLEKILLSPTCAEKSAASSWKEMESLKAQMDQLSADFQTMNHIVRSNNALLQSLLDMHKKDETRPVNYAEDLTQIDEFESA